MIINNPSYNSLPEQVEQNRKDIEEIKSSHLIDVDDELSTQSTNAVQNKVITEALNTEEFERKQADEDLEDADTTLQGNIDAEALAREQADGTLQTNIDNEQLARQQADQNLQNQLTPAENTYGTMNSDYVSQGVCTIQRVGKIVVVKVDGMKVDANTPTHEALLISGLPKPKDFFTAIMFPSMNNTFLRTQLVQSGNEGVIRTHYTSNSAFGDNEIVCTFVYIAE